MTDFVVNVDDWMNVDDRWMITEINVDDRD